MNLKEALQPCKFKAFAKEYENKDPRSLFACPER